MDAFTASNPQNLNQTSPKPLPASPSSPATAERGRPQLSLLGFDIYLRTSVVVAASAAVFFLGWIGALIAATLVVSVLVHELFHSIAFRAFGSDSHIVVHLFGGYSLPYTPEKLSHRSWVIAAAAGPLGAFVLLGLPALALQVLDPFAWNGEGLGPMIASVLIWFNVIWGLANLAPIWPFDGGRILFHATKGDWELTRSFTLATSAIGAAVAWRYGYFLVTWFLAFNAMQIWRIRKAPISVGETGDIVDRPSRAFEQHQSRR